MQQARITSYISKNQTKEDRSISKDDHKQYRPTLKQKARQEYYSPLIGLILPYQFNTWASTKIRILHLIKKPNKQEVKSFIKLNIQNYLKKRGKSIPLDKLNIKNLESITSPKFWEQAIPSMLEACLKQDIPEIRFLFQDEIQEVKISRSTVHYLLSHMFFVTMQKQLEWSNEQTKDFHILMYAGKNQNRLQKLKCIVSYFQKYLLLSNQQKKQIVSFRRVFNRNKKYKNQQMQQKLCDVRIEKQNIQFFNNQIMVDFANKVIGGGVLSEGCVQQEILFSIHPQLIVSVLICPKLNDSEALIMKGFRRFSNYEGYSRTFKFKQLLKKDTSRNNIMVAIDAFDYATLPNADLQYSVKNIQREIHKAFVGFSQVKKGNQDRSIVSGKWGCGAFKGDPHLKFLIQWLVCSLIERQFIFVNWGTEQENEIYEDMISQLKQNDIRCHQVLKILNRFDAFMIQEKTRIDVFQYISDFYV